MDLHSRLSTLAFWPHLPRRTVHLRLTFLYGSLFLLSGAALLAITYALVHNALSGPLTTAGSPPQNASGRIVRGHPTGGLLPQEAAGLHQLLVQSAIALAIMAVVSIGLGWLVAGRVLSPIRTMTAATRRISERSLHERLALDGPDDELKDLGDTIDGLLARLEAAFDSQRRFVANASHELRTPLMLSQTLLQVALANPDITLDSLRAACQEVVDAGKDQAQLIDALLTLARSQRGLDHREPVDLTAVVTDVLNVHEPSAAAKRLQVDAALDDASVPGDARLIHRLVSNLVDNAIRYNSTCGRVEVRLAATAGQTALTVTNTGSPVPPEQVSRLLEPFQRAAPDQTASPSGLGLGLAIVADIAAAHGANLAVRPRPEGGLTVAVSSPADPAVRTQGGTQPTPS